MSKILLHIDNLNHYTDAHLSDLLKYLGDGRKALVEHLPEGQNKKQRILASDLLEQEFLKLGLNSPKAYGKTRQGKPKLLDREDISFSLSHSGNLVAAAVWQDSFYEVGIDVEDLSNRQQSVEKLMKLAKRFLRPEEVDIVAGNLPDGLHYSWQEEDMNLSEEEKLIRRFYRIWTFKEAMCKAKDQPLMEVLKEEPYTMDRRDILCRVVDNSVLTLAIAPRQGVILPEGNVNQGEVLPENILLSGSFR